MTLLYLIVRGLTTNILSDIFGLQDIGGCYPIMKRFFILILCISVLSITENESVFGSNKKITITLWELSATEKFISNLVKKFEKENPDVEIKFQQLSWEYGMDKLITSIAAGNTPDVFELGTTWISKFAQAGELLDITDQISDMKKDYFLWESATFDGRIYGVPWLAGTRILFYNRDLFKKAGLDPDNPPGSWSELLSAAKKINSLGKDIYGFAIFVGEPESPWQEFLPFAWSNGAKILSVDMKRCVINSAQMLESLEYYKQLSRFSLLERQSQVNELFAEGKIGIQISGSWNLRFIPRLNPKLNFGVALLPRPDKGQHNSISFGGGELFVISRHTKHPQVALRLIRFLTRREHIMELVRIQQNVVPAIKGCESDPYYLEHPHQRLFLTQLKTAQSPPNHRRWHEIQEHIIRMIEKVLMKNIPAQVALQEAQNKIEQELSEIYPGGNFSDTTIAIALFIILSFIIFLMILIRKLKIKLGYYTSTKSQDFKGLLYLLPWLIIFLIFGIYPLVYSFLISLSKYDILSAKISFVGLRNYLSVLIDNGFHRALWHTFVFSVGTIPFTIGLALFCSVLIHKKAPFKQFYEAGLFLPVTTSVVVIATVFAYIYSPQGLANWILDKLGIIHPQSSWLTTTKSKFDISIPLLSIMAMNIWSSFGYYTVLFLAGLATIPEQYYEAAKLDGASEWQQFLYITLPQLRPIILLVVVINTIYSFQVFPEIFTMTMGGPLGSTTTVVYHLYELGFHKFQMGPACAVGYTLFAILFILAAFQMKLLRLGEKFEE